MKDRPQRIRHDLETRRPVQILHLCQHCNKESEAVAGRDNAGITVTFYNCPQCGKRNDVWINVLVGEEPAVVVLSVEPNTSPETTNALGSMLQLAHEQFKRKHHSGGCPA